MNRTEELIGRILDEKYRIDRLIGRGGMGAVYAGTHLALDRTVAIKVLNPEFIANESALARFAREARTAARVEHPNAVSMYDFGTIEDGGAYLVMELVEGRSLRDLIREHGRFPLPVAIDLVRQAAAAVGAAHAKGVIHRDLKPENMIVREDEDGRLTLTVVDFGIAKLLSSDVMTQVTGPAELVGTPKYMAPEQFSADVVDQRIDVYALGVLFYELLAGRAPFEGTVTEVIGKHLYSAPPPLATFGVEIPEDFERAIMHALEKTPTSRTGSANAFVLELAGACGEDAALGDLLVAGLPMTNALGALRGPATSDHTSTIGSLLPPAGVISASSAAEYITKHHLTRSDVLDEQTRVRSVPIPTLFVPAAPQAAAPRTTDPLPRASKTARNLALPATAIRRWLAPASLGLGGLLLFGTGLWNESAPTEGTAAVPMQTTAVAAPAPPTPLPAIRPSQDQISERGSVLSYGPGSRRKPRAAAPQSASAGERSAADARQQGARRERGRSEEARGNAEQNNSGGTLERILRVDRHIKKLF